VEIGKSGWGSTSPQRGGGGGGGGLGGGGRGDNLGNEKQGPPIFFPSRLPKRKKSAAGY